ncbi:MAG: hypothetical protein P9G45_14965 [Candidatus Contendobacter sp.]|nr:hypothetical protein [Candidatus Contendobacter sp.]
MMRITLSDKDALKQKIAQALQINSRITPLASEQNIVLEDGSAIGVKMSFGFLWVPTSIDPGGDARYGIAMTTPNDDEGQWDVDIFVGPVVSVNKGKNEFKINPYISTVLLYSEPDKKVQTFESQVFDDGKSLGMQTFPIIQIVPTFGNAMNSALAIASMSVQLSLWLQNKIASSSDEKAEELATPAISNLIFNQIVLGFDAEFSGVDIGSISNDWPKYDSAIQNWSTAGGWQAKSGAAYEFTADKGGDEVKMRAWRPSLVLDKESWAIQFKFDRIRTARKDDHVVLAVSAKRDDHSGNLKLLSVDTAARLRTLDDEQVLFETVIDKDENDVLNTWKTEFKLKMSGNPDIVAFGLGIIEDVVEPLLKVVAKALVNNSSR